MRDRRTRFLAASFVLLPAAFLVVVGVLVLVFQRGGIDVAFGVLILCFCAAVLAGAALLVLALKRESDTARLQADFLSKVSHDFRTPLTSIRMFVETLREGRLEDDVRRQRVLGLLAQEAERLSTLIDRLLEFARMEAGRSRYEPRPTDLGALVHAVAARFEARAVGPDVTFAVEVEPDLPLVHADPDAVAEVVQNLLDNAFKYTLDPKRIAVSVHRERPAHPTPKSPRGAVEITVQDNGPGIARQHQGRIFEQFYRVDDRLARATEGSGLGLAISRHIVGAHGGRIRVDSEPGAGATFVITLPIGSA